MSRPTPFFAGAAAASAWPQRGHWAAPGSTRRPQLLQTRSREPAGSRPWRACEKIVTTRSEGGAGRPAASDADRLQPAATARIATKTAAAVLERIAHLDQHALVPRDLGGDEVEVLGVIIPDAERPRCRR